MRKPLIGLTANRDDARSPLSVNAAYSEAVLAAGGIPVLLTFPLSEEDILQLTDTLDGILFTGGGDIHPFFFGEETPKLRPRLSGARPGGAGACESCGRGGTASSRHLPGRADFERGAWRRHFPGHSLAGERRRPLPHRPPAAVLRLHPRSPGTGGARLTPGKDRWPRPAGGQQPPPPGHPAAGAGTYMLRPGPRRDH